MLKPDDLRLILHQLSNLAQPIGYHVERLTELRSDNAVFTHAMSSLPGRLNALERMISRLRLLAKPVELECARVDLSALIKSIWNEVSSSNDFSMLKISMDLGANCFANVDQYWLNLALKELLLNAAEAAINSPKRELKLGVQPDDNCWRIRIGDSGPGIGEEARNITLFFTTKPETGFGLGIPLAEHILQAHQSRILFSPLPGAGGEIGILFPQA